MVTHSNILAWEILWTEEPKRREPKVGYSPWYNKLTGPESGCWSHVQGDTQVDPKSRHMSTYGGDTEESLRQTHRR